MPLHPLASEPYYQRRSLCSEDETILKNHSLTEMDTERPFFPHRSLSCHSRNETDFDERGLTFLYDRYIREILQSDTSPSQKVFNSYFF